MALPSTAITRLDLSATFSEFDLAASRLQFIGPKVLRPRLVGVQAADVGKIPLNQLLITKDDSRAPGGEYKRDDFEFDKFTYATDEHGREVPLDDRTLRIYRDILDAEDIQSQRAVDMVLRNYEIDIAAAIYDTAVWTGASRTTAVSSEWSSAANGKPRVDVENAKRKVRDGCGLEPNALVCNRLQFWNLANTDEIKDLIKYWGGDDPKRINEAMIAAALDLEFILVAGGIKNTANQGQSATLSRVWSDENVQVCRVATTDDPQEPCVGRTFMFSEENAGVGSDEELALIAEEYREEKVRGSVIRVRNDRDIVIMYAAAGHMLSNITA